MSNGTDKGYSTNLDKGMLLHLYAQMLLINVLEKTVQVNYRAGEMPGFIHVSVGQEAVAAAVCACLQKTDWITSTHRGHGHAVAKGADPKRVMAELYGKVGGCCGGRGGTMHIYEPEVGLFGTNGIVGGGIPLAVGLGLSSKVKKNGAVTVCFFGDGAVNHGAFHESINLAGIQDAPVVFVCENNKYATCVSLADTTRNAEVATKAAAYGIPGVAVDGNDVVAMYQATQDAVARARAGQGPTLIEAKTYRTVGHHEGDVLVGTYRTEEELEAWKTKCPIKRFQKCLLDTAVATADQLEEIEARIDQIVNAAVEFARQSPQPDVSTMFDHSWAKPFDAPPPPAQVETVQQGWLDAVCDGIAEEMRRDGNIMVLGEGIGERGGSWGHTKGLWQEFGGERVIDTPICELGFTGAAIGASASGSRTIADLMVADFLFEAGSQIVQQAGKLHYVSNGKIDVPVVIRAGSGVVRETGPHHSGAYHAVWAHCTGLIVAVPSNPADAKGLMKSALRGNNPVIFLESKTLLSTKGMVPTGEHYVPFGQARVARPGADITIAACGLGVPRSLEAAEKLAQQDISCEVIDLRTIVPLDIDTIKTSVAKTNHLLVVDEDYPTCGVGSEIAAAMMEQAFDNLDAPVGRLHTDAIPQPFSPPLNVAAQITAEKVIAAVKAVLTGNPPTPYLAPLYGTKLTAPTAAVAPVAITSEKAVATSSVDGIPIKMPVQDLTITEATIIRWNKDIGDPVKAGEAVVEVETDKATIDIEAPADGALAEILAPAETVVALGQQIGTIKNS